MTDSGFIFISYARRDGSEYAFRFHTQLAQYGFDSWLDQRGIDETQDFTAEIEKAIEASSYVVTCITPDVRRDTSFVRREIGYAQIVQKPIIVARFANVPPPISVVNHTWLDFFPDWDGPFKRLCDLLRDTAGSPAPPPASSQPDPYQTYLEALYKDVVRYLDRTVFSVLPRQGQMPLIPLHSQAAPDAVITPDEMQVQAMPLAFFDMAGIEDRPTTYHSVHDAFDENAHRLLLLGAPGSGKTTTLMAFARDMVARRLADPTHLLPVLAPIALWDSDRHPTLADWLVQAIPPLKDDIAAILAQGRALLLLDGLDELGDEREDSKTKELYDPRLRFLHALPTNNQVLITCRRADYYSIPEKARLTGAITLQPLDDAQLKNYLHDIPDLWAALQADDQLREMARTPLLLSLFAYAFSGLGDEARQLIAIDQGDIRDKVFETYVSRRYTHEQRKPQAHIAFSLDDLYQRLGAAGMRNASDRKLPQNVFSVEDFNEGPDPGALVELAVRLNILVPLAPGTRYRFVHLLLRDYFTFLYAVPRLTDPDWGVITSAAQALSATGDRRTIEPLLAAFASGNTYVRSTIAQVLGKFKAEEAIPALIDGLLSTKDHITTKRSIARALVNIGSPALEPLIGVLHGPSAAGQIEAAYALGQMGAIDPLAAAVESGSPDLRGAAVHGLSEASGPRVLNLLLTLVQDEDTRVRHNAVRGLDRLADPRSVPALIRLLEDETVYLSHALIRILYASRYALNQRICDIAADALARIGTPEALAAVESWRRKQDKKS
ncbi:MAG: HEAT repeat domain-containing protein [Anaerolineae bacterium]|nr:HEAT repeat domain-containing protein [Anaerolineae bacterium]